MGPKLKFEFNFGAYWLIITAALHESQTERHQISQETADHKIISTLHEV
jgi:hypothetical protein